MNFKNFEWCVQLDCCGSGRKEVAGAPESSNAPSGSRKCGNFLTSWEPVSFWGRTLLHEVIYLVKHYKSIWRSWPRHCATSRKVAGSIPDYVIEIFHWHNPSGRTVALGSTQPLTEMSTRNISWVVKTTRARADNLTTFMCDCLEIREPQNPGTLTACPGL